MAKLPSVGAQTASFERYTHEAFSHNVGWVFCRRDFTGFDLAVSPGAIWIVLGRTIVRLMDPAPEMMPATVEVSCAAGDGLGCCQDEGTCIVFEDGGLDE